MGVQESVWIEVCAVVDIPKRGSRVLKTEAGCFALFRTYQDEIFALDDQCPHKGGPLSQGIVHDRAVACPLHNLVFDLETGKARGADESQVRTYPTRHVDGRVFVDIASWQGAD